VFKIKAKRENKILALFLKQDEDSEDAEIRGKRVPLRQFNDLQCLCKTSI
jgi:hypothetical protein